MANFYSDQITQQDITKPVAMLKPTDLQGRVRCALWTFTTPASSAPAVGEYVALCKLPANARITSVHQIWEAMSSGAGTAGADIGTATDNLGTGFAAAISAQNMDSAGNANIPVLDKWPAGTPATSAAYLCAKVTGEAWATTKKYQGCVFYVVD